MKNFRCLVEYRYPIIHEPPTDVILHDGCIRVDKAEFITEDVKPIVIEELEKIKAEIEEKRKEMESVKDWGRYYGLNLSHIIIDIHIEELKGENK